VSGRDELRRELEEKAESLPPADLSTFALPGAIDGEDRIAFAKGLTAFREGDFYLAHDLWEEVWHNYRGADRRFLQGMIHIAVGSYHVQCRNPKGARSQLAKARAKMSPYAPRHWGMDVAGLLACVDLLGNADVHDPSETEPRLDDLRNGVRRA
jgi:hypothetical protein